MTEEKPEPQDTSSLEDAPEGVAPEEDFNEADMDAELTEDEATQDVVEYGSEEEEEEEEVRPGRP